jgi:hypothetical protein
VIPIKIHWPMPGKMMPFLIQQTSTAQKDISHHFTIWIIWVWWKKLGAPTFDGWSPIFSTRIHGKSYCWLA